MRRRFPAAIAAVALAITGVAIGVQYALPGPAHADEDTISQNLSRDGWDSSEPILSPATVEPRRALARSSIPRSTGRYTGSR